VLIPNLAKVANLPYIGIFSAKDKILLANFNPFDYVASGSKELTIFPPIDISPEVPPMFLNKSFPKLDTPDKNPPDKSPPALAFTPALDKALNAP
jgi:hypothetical protein